MGVIFESLRKDKGGLGKKNKKFQVFGRFGYWFIPPNLTHNIRHLYRFQGFRFWVPRVLGFLSFSGLASGFGLRGF